VSVARETTNILNTVPNNKSSKELPLYPAAERRKHRRVSSGRVWYVVQQQQDWSLPYSPISGLHRHRADANRSKQQGAREVHGCEEDCSGESLRGGGQHRAKSNRGEHQRRTGEHPPRIVRQAPVQQTATHEHSESVRRERVDRRNQAEARTSGGTALLRTGTSGQTDQVVASSVLRNHTVDVQSAPLSTGHRYTRCKQLVKELTGIFCCSGAPITWRTINLGRSPRVDKTAALAEGALRDISVS